MEIRISAPTSSAFAPFVCSVSPRSHLSTWLSPLAVCLTVAGLLTIAPSPVQAIESPMEAESTLHLVCAKSAEQFICKPDRATASGFEASSEASATQIRATATIEPVLFSANQQAIVSNWLLGLAYLLPLGLGLSIFLCDRYTHYRAEVIKHQIETLERIWQRAQQEQG